MRSHWTSVVVNTEDQLCRSPVVLHYVSLCSNVEIDRLTRSDVADAYTLSQQAGWGFREDDWHQLLGMPSVHGFAGRINDTLRATATVVHYDSIPSTGKFESVAWIGSILVDESYRRQGLGTQIFDTALSHATSYWDIIGLDANDHGKPIYANSGFESVAETTQWSGTISATGCSDKVKRCNDPTKIFDLDVEACGVDRSFLLRRLWKDPSSRAFIRQESDCVTGYVLVRPSMNGWTVGPLVSDTPAGARNLLVAVGEVTGDDAVVLNVAGKSDAAKHYRDVGLERVRNLTRMTHRQRAQPLLSEQIRAIPGFAFG